MKKLLLLHGPNLNRLGSRDPGHYGSLTLPELEQAVTDKAREAGFEVETFQSNHEGALIDCLQERVSHCDALIINPGAFSHYSYALYDAIVDSQLPTIEVHLSNLKEREPWRWTSVIAPACLQSIMGKKLQGYLDAVDAFVEHFTHAG